MATRIYPTNKQLRKPTWAVLFHWMSLDGTVGLRILWGGLLTLFAGLWLPFIAISLNSLIFTFLFTGIAVTLGFLMVVLAILMSKAESYDPSIVAARIKDSEDEVLELDMRLSDMLETHYPFVENPAALRQELPPGL